MRDNDWGIGTYPMVPGHEGIGVIKAVGSDVTALKVSVCAFHKGAATFRTQPCTYAGLATVVFSSGGRNGGSWMD
jgi:D-arabinose 1-dehydrogenase-like Zn-dependent alcohol dehydrogenase